MQFWAHSDPWQPLAEHLENVGKLARRLASLAAPDDVHFHDIAEWSGLLHDLGKYQDGFQERIRGSKVRCPHAIHGAAMAFHETKPSLRSLHVALAIAGHHAGMPDRTGGSSSLVERVKAAYPIAEQLIARAARESPELSRLFAAPAPTFDNLGKRFDLLTRMVFSCLVDADRLDSAGRELEQTPLCAQDRLDTLLRHIGGLKGDSSQTVSSARSEILENCLTAAEWPNRLLSLSAPTGGGKTLAAMAFALKRAALHPGSYRRVIVVIPYLSIIEQNAQVYADVFGKDAVLEHHSGSFERLVRIDRDHFAPEDEGEREYVDPSHRNATENWDAPLVVTTSVRFFESLFSNRPGDLRRVHNIARSIIILDEVQVLPRNLLAPLLDMIKELSDHWGCTFVLSTATKPAFEKAGPLDGRDPRWPPGTLREIIAEPASLHTRLRRVTIDWRISEQVDWPEAAGWMREHPQALCVVNLRDHAMQLFQILADTVNGEERSSLFHLSTRMCPAHRLNTIAAIRQRLQEGLPCRVVSTQLIEAGVDIDFPVAFRALGPLDAIIQVAGRADRAGKLTAALGIPAGRLIVFRPVDDRVPPNEYKNATDVTFTAARRRSIQVDDIGRMSEFYERYYNEGADLDSGDFRTMREKSRFKTLADNFEMISSRTQDVLVPYGEGQILIDKLRLIGVMTVELRSKLQRFTVGLHPWEFEDARKAVLSEIRPGNNLWELCKAAYDLETGLRTMLDPEQLIC